MDQLKQKLKEIADKLKLAGLPLLYLRDPISQKPSVSLTLLFISAHLVIFSLLNKVANWFKGVDADGALEFFIVCSSLYFGRSLVSKSGTKLKEETKEEE